MGALSPILRSVQGGGLSFRCPACNEAHVVWHGDGPGPRWRWNGNAERPTFTPSIRVSFDRWEPPVTPENLAQFNAAPWSQHKVQSFCHSFVTDGRIAFCSDCTHALAGQTVDLPPWPR